MYRLALPVLIFLFIILNSPEIFPQTPFRDSLAVAVQRSIELTINQEYPAAENIGRQLASQYPSHPIGYLFLAATIQSKMMDFETTVWENEFFAFLDSTRSRAQKYSKNHPEDAWAYFYLGSTDVYRGFYESKQNRYFAAYHYVVRGIDQLKNAVELNPEIYDAYLGLGSYLFWRSEKTKSLAWLPFISDEREAGLQLILKSIENGQLTRFAGINGLVWIYLEQKNYEQALHWAQIGAAAFPNSRYFHWCLAETFFRKQDFATAVEYYGKILISLNRETFNNHYNEIVCHQKIAQAYLETRQYQLALVHCLAVEKIELTPQIRHRARNKLARLEEIKKSCQPQFLQTNLIDALN
jgi:hypothetical protein